MLAVSDAVDRVRKATGKDPHLGGYSQGGMFCYQAAALRRGEGLCEPHHVRQPGRHRRRDASGHPRGHRDQRLADVLAVSPLARSAVPAWMSRTGFRLLDPVKAARQQFDFVRQLHDREALLPRERQRQFLQADGWVAWPGPALADFLKQFVAHNRMLDGGFVIDERLVTLADIECPILTVVGEVDEIAPANAVRAIIRAAPRAEVYELDPYAPATSVWSWDQGVTRPPGLQSPAGRAGATPTPNFPTRSARRRGSRRARRERRRHGARRLRALVSPAASPRTWRARSSSGAGRTRGQRPHARRGGVLASFRA